MRAFLIDRGEFAVNKGVHAVHTGEHAKQFAWVCMQCKMIKVQVRVQTGGWRCVTLSDLMSQCHLLNFDFGHAFKTSPVSKNQLAYPVAAHSNASMATHAFMQNQVLTCLHSMLGSNRQLTCVLQEMLLKSWLRLHRVMPAASQL